MVSEDPDLDILDPNENMNENQDNSYIDNRRFKKNSELKHYMYAGQWFLFSIVAFIFMIILLRRDTNKDEKTK